MWKHTEWHRMQQCNSSVLPHTIIRQIIAIIYMSWAQAIPWHHNSAAWTFLATHMLMVRGFCSYKDTFRTSCSFNGGRCQFPLLPLTLPHPGLSSSFPFWPWRGYCVQSPAKSSCQSNPQGFHKGEAKVERQLNHPLRLYSYYPHSSLDKNDKYLDIVLFWQASKWLWVGSANRSRPQSVWLSPTYTDSDNPAAKLMI